jgi:phospholipid/cholesterol/gamma-HCH transport system substrate-binding protein
VLDAAGRLVEENRETIEAILADIKAFTGDLREKGPGMVAKLDSTLTRVDELLKDQDGLVQMLLTDEDLSREFAAALKDVRGVAGKLNRGDSVLWAMFGEEDGKTVREDFLGAIENVNAVTAAVRNGQGTLGRLVEDEGLYEEVKALAAHLARSLGPEGGLGKVLADSEVWKKIDPALENLNIAAANIRDATIALQEQRGVLGMLLNDPESRKEVRNSIKSLSDFIETTRENAPITTFAGILLSPF